MANGAIRSTMEEEGPVPVICAFVVRATKTYTESILERMLPMMESTDFITHLLLRTCQVISLKLKWIEAIGLTSKSLIG